MILNEPVTLSEYNPVWPDLFVAEKRAILESAIDGVRGIEHIGSTAVPGLLAKPIIDILVGGETLPPDKVQVSCLQDLGYDYLGEAGVPGRFYFRKRGKTSFNVAFVQWKGSLWRQNLLLRDFFRSYPEYATRYAKLKKAAIVTGDARLLEYSEHKKGFLTKMLVLAEGLQK